jgi:hypothetical protein
LHRKLVARDLADYLDIARRALSQRPQRPPASSVATATAPSPAAGTWLAQVRHELSDARMEAPLFDTRLWTRASEAAVRLSWEIHLLGLLPRHVVVSSRAGTGKHHRRGARKGRGSRR